MLSTMLDGDEGDVVGRSTGGVRATVGPARQKRVLLSLHGSRYGHLGLEVAFDECDASANMMADTSTAYEPAASRRSCMRTRIFRNIKLSDVPTLLAIPRLADLETSSRDSALTFFYLSLCRSSH